MLDFPSLTHLVDLRGRLPTRPDGLPYRTRPLDAIDGVVIHASAADMAPEAIALYQTTKVEGDPYPAIAYHFVVRPDGETAWCQDLETETWHAGAEGSAHNIALLLAGAGSEPPPAEQVAAARALLADLRRALGRDLALHPHVDLTPAARCPGPGWPALAAALTEEAVP